MPKTGKESPYFKDHTGAVNTAKNGMKITIVAYRLWDDVDVLFEDGTLVTHKTYRNFMLGNIRHPDPTKQAKKKATPRHIGDTNTAKNGMKITIIEYRTAKDIDVQFEDGVIVYHKAYRDFQLGKIRHPDPAKQAKRKANICIGTTNRANNGMMMTIIAIYGYNDIDVQFEDGSIAEHKTYDAFLGGKIQHPTGVHTLVYKRQQEYVGKTNKNTQGLKMTVIAYLGAANVTVQFEDGTIVEHTTMQAFNHGWVRNPNYTPHIGETNKNNQGYMMTLIKYVSARDVTVKFDTGDIVEHTQYSGFSEGHLMNPGHNPHMHEKINSVQGIQMEIIRYAGKRNIDIKYETGCQLTNKNYEYFIKGMYNHPLPYQIGNISMDKFAYIHNEVGNFYCHCPKCNLEDIMSIQEMREHVCVK